MLETAGSSLADVTFNSIFITDWANYAAVNKVYAEYFPGEKPARYCIQCGAGEAGLPGRDRLDRAQEARWPCSTLDRPR